MADILPPAPIDAPFASYGWVDWYKKVRDAINNAAELPWEKITGTPTTIAGYGITDAVYITGSQIKLPLPVNSSLGGFTATLGNSPRNGNPTKWIEVDDNGTLRYQPLW